MPDIITLYHGTTHNFKEIDVRKGKPFKDFGQGFYLAESYERARNIAIRNGRIEENRLRVMGDETRLPVFIYTYEFELLEMNDEPRCRATGYRRSPEELHSGFNTLDNAPEGRGIKPLSTNKLNMKRFDTADREWLRFVIANRINRTRQHDYDIVIGPTANDDTRASIRAVMNTANGAIMSDSALNLLIEMLEPDNLPMQYYFGTSRAAAMLKLTGRDELK